jgi:hypothetical protein
VFNSADFHVVIKHPPRARHTTPMISLDLWEKSEEYPHFYLKDYRERVERFCGKYIWCKIIGEITIEFIEAAVVAAAPLYEFP